MSYYYIGDLPCPGCGQWHGCICGYKYQYPQIGSRICSKCGMTVITGDSCLCDFKSNFDLVKLTERYNNQIKINKKEVKKMAKLSVKNVNVVGANVELTLNISGVNSAAAMKVQNLISVIQAAAADGKFSFSEDLAIGLAFGMLFAND